MVRSFGQPHKLTHLNLRGGRQEIEVLLQRPTLQIASLPEVATLCVLVLIKAMGEVLAGHTNHHTLRALKVSLVDVAPSIHSPT